MLMSSISQKHQLLETITKKKKINKRKLNVEKHFIIFEIANNHMGDLAHGINIINEFAKVRDKYKNHFDFALKFQFRDLKTFIHKKYKGSNLKFVKRFEETKLTKSNWTRLFKVARKHNFKLLATPFDERSVNKILLNRFNLIKIASCSFTDWPLLEKIAQAKKEVIFSTAGSNIEQIDSVVSFFENRNIKYTIMHCVGKYPTKDYQLNLGTIELFTKRYPNSKVGFSTHENPDNFISGSLALAMGAKVFEKHIGIETDKYKVNKYTANPEQINKWLHSLMVSKIMVGERNKRPAIYKEKKELRDLQRGIFLKKSIKKGSKITKKDIYFSIPGCENGLVANDLSKYKDFIATKNIKQDEQLDKINCRVLDNRENVFSIVKRIRLLVEKSGVLIPNGVELEISHHYGIRLFLKYGISMFNIVNQEYCKKIIVVLGNQNHPEQYHKIKKETFHILYGSLNLKLNGKLIYLKPKDIITIDPGVNHEFSSKSGCIFEEISTNHKVSDSYYTDSKINNNKNRKTFVKFWR